MGTDVKWGRDTVGMPEVWIDQHECMGAGTCEQIAPGVFRPIGDGLWAVAEQPPHFSESVIYDGGAGQGHGPQGAAGKARVPLALLDDVVEAAEECPGECIYVEPAS
jgi:ferredoxin